jgi:hypothetical protein
LCDMLREGPFESFQQVHDCEVTFSFLTTVAILEIHHNSVIVVWGNSILR